MDTEFEATFTNINKDDLHKRLKSIDAELVTPERMMRRWTLDFDHPEENFHRWARVRDEGDKITATYKRHTIDKSDSGIDHQKEIEIEVDEFETAVDLLEAVGCERRMYQESKREEWKKDEVEIVIDTWPHLEPFCEIEGPSEEVVKETAKALDFDYDKAVFAGTGALYEDKYGVFPDNIDDLRELTFDSNNPFA